MNIFEKMLGQYLDVCTYQKNLSAKTVKAYRIDLLQFIEYSSIKSNLFDRESVNQYIAYLNQNYKPRSVKRKIASLKAFCTWLDEEGYLLENPFHKLRIKLNEPLVLPKTIPLRVIEQLLSAAYQAHKKSRTNQELKISLRDIAVIELLFATGMRVSELCGLNTEDIDLIDGTVKIYGKGPKERVLQITNNTVIASLRNYINEYRPRAQSPFFLTQRQTRLAEQSVRLALRKYAGQIGINWYIAAYYFAYVQAFFRYPAS